MQKTIAFALSMLALGITAPSAAASYVDTVLATNPVAHFRLNNVNEPSLLGGYTTNWQNGVTLGAGAPIAADPANRGATFPGTGGNVINTSLAGNTPGTGSIVAWINAAQLPSVAGRIFYIAGESQFANDFDLQFDQSNNISFCLGVGGGQCSIYTPDPGTAVGNWHMVVATYDGRGDGSTDFSRIYWDGALVSNRNEDFDGRSHSSAFTIGYSSVFGGREFAGGIDEVTAYDRALSTGEVAALYAARLDPGAPAVPEPAAWGLLIAGFGATGAALRRRRSFVRITYA